MDTSFLNNFKNSLEAARQRLLPRNIANARGICAAGIAVPVALVLAGLPAVAEAKVVINEIAWMGTAASANAEWIELFNDGTSKVSLDGWSLEAADGTPKIALKGSVSGNGYFLLERTSDDSVPGIPADQIYSGSLGNDGELLLLKDASGAEVDRVDGSDGWKIGGSQPIGDNATKQTAQRFASGWATATGTPRAANVAPLPVPNPSLPSDSSATASSTDPGSSSQSAIPGTDPTGDATGSSLLHSDPVIVSSSDATSEMLEVGAGRSRVAAPGSLLSFSASFKSKAIGTPGFFWTFGDGSSASGQVVTHRFLYPGEYEVVLNADSGGTRGVSRVHVRVPELKLSIISLERGTAGLHNAAGSEVNIGGWILQGGGVRFLFPDDTIVASQSSIRIDQAVSHIPENATIVSLADPIGRTVAELHSNPPSPLAASSTLDSSASQGAKGESASSTGDILSKGKKTDTAKQKPIPRAVPMQKHAATPLARAPASRALPAQQSGIGKQKPVPVDQSALFLDQEIAASSSPSWIESLSAFFSSWF